MKKYAYIGCLGFLAVITTEFGVIGILPQVAEHYGTTIDRAGLLLSIFALIIALTGPFMTLLVSRFDRKKVMLLAIGLFLVTGLVSALSPPFWLLLLVRVLPAFLQPVYIATALSVAVSKGDEHNENELMGIVFSGVAMAMVTTVPFATYMASILTWEYSFVVQALVSFIALVVIYFGLPNIPVQERKSYGSQIRILRQPLFIISTAMNFFMIAAWFCSYSYFAEYLINGKGMDPTQVSYMLLLFGLVGVLANWVSGKLLDRNIPMTTALFLSGTVLVPIGFHFAKNSPTATILVIALWGFLYSPSFLNASTYMISAAPNALEFANSLATSFGNLGITTGTTIGGYIIATQGVENTPWAGMLFGLLALSMIGVRALLERNSKKRRCQEEFDKQEL